VSGFPGGYSGLFMSPFLSPCGTTLIFPSVPSSPCESTPSWKEKKTVATAKDAVPVPGGPETCRGDNLQATILKTVDFRTFLMTARGHSKVT
jgi:hypothetical protein